MRSALVIISIALLTGCASQPSQQPQAVATEEPADAVLASALVFDPPVILDEPPVVLDREPRERSAFVAFEDQTVTFSYLHIDDRQIIDSRHGRDRYER